jgi:uncharacterized protein (TIGR02646 family)
MKKVTKDFAQVPATLKTARCQKLIEDALKKKGAHKFNSDVYGSPDVRTALDSIYNEKCGFCESNTKAGAAMQVEHYRPKAKVIEDTTHPGYYWLGYEWSNLLLSCATCNRKKWNHFELNIGAKQQRKPPMRAGKLNKARCLVNINPLAAELPKLLNPEVETNVRQHFIYDGAGQISGTTAHGVYTITCTGLDRKPLNIARKKVLDRCELMILEAVARYDNGTDSIDEARGAIIAAFRQLLLTYLNNEPYSEYAFHCWHRVPAYLIQPLRPEFQAVAHAAYQRIQQALGTPVV